MISRPRAPTRIVCVSVNDPFVMGAWGEDQNVGHSVVMLADGNGEFTEAMGLTMDGSGFGLGPLRSQRYAAIIDDGIVTWLAVEPGPGLVVARPKRSSARSEFDRRGTARRGAIRTTSARPTRRYLHPSWDEPGAHAVSRQRADKYVRQARNCFRNSVPCRSVIRLGDVRMADKGGSDDGCFPSELARAHPRAAVLGVGTACLFWALPAASADPALSSIVLPSTFPDMVAAPPGAGNGPVTAGDLDLLGVNPSAASTAAAQLGDGRFSGYLRMWSRPSNGDVVAIGAFRFQSPAAADNFLAQANHATATQPGLSVDGAQGIPGASVYTIGSLANGATQLLNFDQGNDVFMIAERSPSVDLTLADAVTLANQQAAWSSGKPVASSSSSWSHRVGEIFGALAAATLLIWLFSHWVSPRLMEGRHARVARRKRASGQGAGAYPPPPRGAKDAGWLPNPVHMNEQLFWNGNEWAGRRRWLPGSGWVEQTPAHAG